MSQLESIVFKLVQHNVATERGCTKTTAPVTALYYKTRETTEFDAPPSKTTRATGATRAHPCVISYILLMGVHGRGPARQGPR
eukprot:4005428-Amphidinium_carterae.1